MIFVCDALTHHQQLLRLLLLSTMLPVLVFKQNGICVTEQIKQRNHRWSTSALFRIRCYIYLPYAYTLCYTILETPKIGHLSFYFYLINACVSTFKVLPLPLHYRAYHVCACVCACLYFETLFSAYLFIYTFLSIHRLKFLYEQKYVHRWKCIKIATFLVVQSLVTR